MECGPGGPAGVSEGRAEVHARGFAAGVAVRLAAERPDLVSALVLRAPPLLDRDARQDMAARIPDIAPTEDGGYLLRLWHHLRDQELWSPWYRRERSQARTVAPQIDPADLQRRAVPLLRQAAQYRAVWQAALEVDIAAAIAAAGVPVRLTVHPSDAFAETLAGHPAEVLADPEGSSNG